MSDQHDTGPCRRDALTTNGFSMLEIPGLITVENTNFLEAENWAKVTAGTKPTYSHDEIYGQYCNVNFFVEAPLAMVFEYISNVYSLEEWTLTLRNFRYVGGGVYRGYDSISTENAKNTPIYMKIDAYADCHVVDHLCAWDQGDELWMRYHFRLLDGMKTIGRPGTVATWFNARHPYYFHDTPAPSHIAEHRARKDRTWVGDLWDHFHAGHSLEAKNMKTILEYRWRNGGR